MEFDGVDSPKVNYYRLDSNENSLASDIRELQRQIFEMNREISRLRQDLESSKRKN